MRFRRFPKCSTITISMCVLGMIGLCLTASNSRAEDWPTYQHDNHRSGISSETLTIPLHTNWTLAPRQHPAPAWEDSPAKQDFWHGFHDLKPRVLYDRANYVSVVGDSLFFGSSTSDTMRCVDTLTGEDRWIFFTEGPVRFAPTIESGKAYFGSDDGYAYCLDATDGELIWKYKPYSGNDRMIGNGRMISPCPVRTSVLVQGSTAYFCAGVFPEEGVYMCALNKDNGSVVWKKQVSISPQGYLLEAGNRLFVPTGNTFPQAYRCNDGALLGSYSSGRSGGTYALIVDEKLVSGPAYSGSGSDLLQAYDTNSRSMIAYVRGNHLIVTAEISYLHTDDSLSALNRAAYFKAAGKRVELEQAREKIGEQIKKARAKSDDGQVDKLVDNLAAIEMELKETEAAQAGAILWTVPCAHPFSLVLANDVLLAGGDGEIAVYHTSDGASIWSGIITGRAYGITVANGGLYVSTDQGTIHRFSSETGIQNWRYY